MASNPKPATLAEWGELKFLRWLRARVESSPVLPPRELILGIGDDCAHLRLKTNPDLLVKTDALVEGVDFKHEWISPRDLGAKAMTENLSDIAAMGARPLAAFLSLGVPPSARVADLKAFILGVIAQGHRYHCTLAGGDLGRAPQWTINVMLLGQPAVKGRVILRSSAKPGQKIFVTGTPGDSAAGLAALQRSDAERTLIARHNRPTPRLEEGALLARLCPDLAMIDVSDGVANDAAHISRESGVAISLRIDTLPVSAAAARYAKALRLDARDWTIFGGEAYELLFTTAQPIAKIERTFRRAGLATRVTEIGSVVNGKGVMFLDASGRAVKLKDKTFRHFG